MGIFDQAKEFAKKHSDKIDQGVDKAGDLLDQRTGGKHADHVDRAQDFVKDRLDPDRGNPEDPAPPASNPPSAPPTH